MILQLCSLSEVEMRAWDAEFTGLAIQSVGCLIMFGTSIFALVFGVKLGQYGSPVGATVFSGVGLVALSITLLKTRDPVNRSELSKPNGVLACVMASVMLLNPLPSIFGLVALVAGLLIGVGGIILIGSELNNQPRLSSTQS